MSESEFERSVNQREPDAYVKHLRQKAAEEAVEPERFLRPAIEAHLDTYQHGIDFLAFAHAQVIDCSDLDLAKATRSTAVWDIAGRAISLANALIDQLRRGYGPQTIGTTRLMFEAVSLLEALIEAPEIVVRKWLDGKHIPTSEARKHMVTLAVRSVEESAEAGEGVLDSPAYQALAAGIEATPEYEKFIQEKQDGAAPEGIAAIVEHIHREEYDELSHKRGGHNDRESLEFARDARLRRYVYGPHPDPRVQAAYVVNAGHDIQRVVIVAGFAFAKFFFGPSYQWDAANLIQQWFEGIRQAAPLP